MYICLLYIILQNALPVLYPSNSYNKIPLTIYWYNDHLITGEPPPPPPRWFAMKQRDLDEKVLDGSGKGIILINRIRRVPP
jgi:hypothetical protein